MAAVGSAVGLGNLWRFPFETGQNGGSAFVLVYLACVFLIAFPVLMSEFAIGRHAQKSAVASTRKIATDAKKSSRWSVVGWVCMIGGFLVLTIYSVIAGQIMAYATGGFMGLFAVDGGIETFLNGPDGDQGTSRGMVWHFVFMVLTVMIVARGLKGGIERVVTILMPLFFVMLLGLTLFAVVRGLGDGSTWEAAKYLFTPNWGAVNASVVIAALGQAFFSVGVASAIMITYGSYLTKDTNIGENAFFITSADTLVALIAGFMIFPVLFAAGAPLDGNPIFDALPGLFAAMPGGQFIGGAFFFLAVIAALTSSISLLEATVAFFDEHSDFGRATSSWILGGFAFMIGAGAVYSSEFDGWVNLLSGETLLPLGGFLIAVFVGWVIPKKLLREELSHASPRLFGFFHFMMRWVVPFAVGAVFVLGVDANFNNGQLNAALGLG
jgi:NSS family neurotransmitter:Na+ symporter